ALGVSQLVDVVVCAQDADVACFKPDPRGLLVALVRLGVPPGEAVYVGDRATVDADAARAAGMRCVLVGDRGAAEAAGVPHASDFATLARILLAPAHPA
ncbi:MAG TPA: HAD family hydrolase, partial [Gemmatimonadaceae bacterium]|nr:HAD family hydrolase [Gemmatimonadaceae bacterium]